MRTYAALWPDAPALTPDEIALLAPYCRAEISLAELAQRVQAYYSMCAQKEERVVKATKSAARIK